MKSSLNPTHIANPVIKGFMGHVKSYPAVIQSMGHRHSMKCIKSMTGLTTNTIVHYLLGRIKIIYTPPAGAVVTRRVKHSFQLRNGYHGQRWTITSTVEGPWEAKYVRQYKKWSNRSNYERQLAGLYAKAHFEEKCGCTQAGKLLKGLKKHAAKWEAEHDVT